MAVRWYIVCNPTISPVTVGNATARARGLSRLSIDAADLATFLTAGCVLADEASGTVAGRQDAASWLLNDYKDAS